MAFFSMYVVLKKIPAEFEEPLKHIRRTVLLRRGWTDMMRKAAALTILTDLVRTYKQCGFNEAVYYSRRDADAAQYNIPRYRAKDVPYQLYKEVFDALERGGWIEQIIGKRHEAYTQATISKAFARALGGLEDIPIRFDYPPVIVRHKKKYMDEVRRDGEIKKLMRTRQINLDFEDTPETDSDYAFIVKYRRLMENCETTAITTSFSSWPNKKRTDISWSFSSARKIYSAVNPRYPQQGFGLHGRIHGDWTGLPKEDRKTIFIDGQPVVERDYHASSIQICYGMVKAQPVLKGVHDKLYKIENISQKELGRRGFELAYDITKLVWQIMTASKSMQSVATSVGRHLSPDELFTKKDEYEKRNRLAQRYQKLKDKHKGLRPSDVARKLINRHEPIAHLLFNQDQYLPLDRQIMYVESTIATEIVSEFINQNKPIIPIFDSYLVREEDLDLLEAMMIEKFQQVLGVLWTPLIH